MSKQPWRLPWSLDTVPHAVLDILRGCNISCRACYNTLRPQAKSLEEVRQELAILVRRRKLSSVSIAGGEPILHEQLLDIVRLVKSAGLGVELFSNGLQLEPAMLAQLKGAGVDLIFLHIEAQQNRPDLPRPSIEALRELRTAKAAMVAAAGIDAALAVTAYPDALEEVSETVRFTLTSPHVNHLLVTLHRDVPNLGPLTGGLDIGILGTPPSRHAARQPLLDNRQMQAWLREHFGLTPFACVGSNVDADDPRWLSYLVGTVIHSNGEFSWRSIGASGAERLFLAVHQRLRGRYPFYLPHSPARLRMQVLLNAVSGGRMWGNLLLLARSLGRRRTLVAKRLLFQDPAYVGADGRLIHCSCCPDAVVRHGELVPVCISDQVVRSS